MTITPLPIPPAEDRDAAHLRTLSICWYILSIFQAFTGCIVLGYIVLVLLMGVGMASSGHSDDATAGAAFSGFFGCFGLALLAFWWGLAFLNFNVARSLAKRRHRGLCFVMAAFACLFVPLGTILGVFTFVTLSRPSVQNSFT
jgi:hypothetical protein